VALGVLNSLHTLEHEKGLFSSSRYIYDIYEQPRLQCLSLEFIVYVVNKLLKDLLQDVNIMDALDCRVSLFFSPEFIVYKLS
jgi:hypothetical protein